MAARAGILITLALLVAVLVLWPTPDDARRTPTQPEPGGRLSVVVFDPLDDRNPLTAADEGARLLRALTYGTLLRWDPDTLDLVPGLAEDWQSGDAGRSLTFVLRPGVHWSDGVPFTADDVRFTLETIRARGDTPGFTEDGLPVLPGSLLVDSPDARTVTVAVAAPDGLHVTDFATLPVLPAHRLGGDIGAPGLRTPWPPGGAAPAGLPALGPFILERHEATRVVLRRNPAYWRTAPDGAPLPFLDALVLEPVDGMDTALGRIESGQVDAVAADVPLDAFVRLRRSEQAGRLQLLDLGVRFEADALWFCLRPDTLASHPVLAYAAHREFRQALSHAVDREAFAHEVYGGHAVPLWGPVTPADREAFSPDVARYPPDADRARDLLAAIGLADRSGDGRLRDASGVAMRLPLVAVAGEAAVERATARIAGSARALGLEVDVQLMPAADLHRRMAACDAAAFYGRPPGPAGVRPDPLLAWFGAGRPWSPLPGLANGWVRDLETRLADYASADPAGRRDRGRDIQRVLGEHLPLVVFAVPRAYAVVGPRVVVPEARAWPPLLWNAEHLGVRSGSAVSATP